MSAALWVLLGTAVLVVVLGVLWRLRSGRVRVAAGRRPAPPVLAELAGLAGVAGLGGVAEPPDLDGHAVTLLQLSTSFCAPCRRAAVVLAELAGRTPGLRHVEVDVTDRPSLCEALKVRTTPTTLAVDPQGRELLRLVGVPDRDALSAALGPHLGRM